MLFLLLTLLIPPPPPPPPPLLPHLFLLLLHLLHFFPLLSILLFLLSSFLSSFLPSFLSSHNIFKAYFGSVLRVASGNIWGAICGAKNQSLATLCKEIALPLYCLSDPPSNFFQENIIFLVLN